MAFKELLENEKNNFKLVNGAVAFLGGVPAMINPADMSNTIPCEKVRPHTAAFVKMWSKVLKKRHLFLLFDANIQPISSRRFVRVLLTFKCFLKSLEPI